jgi:UDP-2,3-diacylglucosamine pyrophosphatase LpxH
MDVNAASVAALLHEHGFPLLIHGHTHRPAEHRTNVDSHAASAGCSPTGAMKTGSEGRSAGVG